MNTVSNEVTSRNYGPYNFLSKQLNSDICSFFHTLFNMELRLRRKGKEKGRKKKGRKNKGRKKKGRKNKGRKEKGRKNKGRKKKGRKNKGRKRKGRKK